MIKYYFEFDGTMNLKEYNVKNGIKKVGNSILLYNNAFSVSGLYDTIESALRSLGGYSKSVIYNGQNINPQKNDIFGYVGGVLVQFI